MNKLLKVVAIVVVMTCIFGTVAMAAPTVSVTIYSSDTSADSISLYCSNLIDGFGVNDKSSTNDLYYTLRKEGVIGSSEVLSILMKPGTGSMGKSSVSSWYTLFTGLLVPDGSGYYFIRLNPKGLFGKDSYGAGKLVD